MKLFGCEQQFCPYNKFAQKVMKIKQASDEEMKDYVEYLYKTHVSGN